MKGLIKPTVNELLESMMDIGQPELPVEVKIDHPRRVLWINVGPVCVLRICQAEIHFEAIGQQKKVT